MENWASSHLWLVVPTQVSIFSVLCSVRLHLQALRRLLALTCHLFTIWRRLLVRTHQAT
jgi:hypothetical protein